MISSTDSIIAKQCIIYQSQFPKEICNIIMDFMFYELVTVEAKRKHGNLNKRVTRSINSANRVTYSMDSSKNFSDPYEIYFGLTRYCVKVDFELSYSHRDEPAVFMSFTFCKQCGNYYDDNVYDADERAVAIKCSCYNFANVCGICYETDTNTCRQCGNYYNEEDDAAEVYKCSCSFR